MLRSTPCARHWILPVSAVVLARVNRFTAHVPSRTCFKHLPLASHILPRSALRIAYPSPSVRHSHPQFCDSHRHRRCPRGARDPGGHSIALLQRQAHPCSDSRCARGCLMNQCSLTACGESQWFARRHCCLRSMMLKRRSCSCSIVDCLGWTCWKRFVNSLLVDCKVWIAKGRNGSCKCGQHQASAAGQQGHHGRPSIDS